MWSLSSNSLKKKEKIDVPKNYFTKCPQCEETLITEKIILNNMICYECDAELRFNSRSRIDFIIDEGTFKEKFVYKKTVNPLEFPEYEEKITNLREQTGLDEAVIFGIANVEGEKVLIGVMDSNFIMGSMGSQVGEKITKAFEFATSEQLPVVLYTASGGARMQEGIISLMQMAKISAAIKRHHEAGLFYMPILTEPTTGGVTASFAMLGDIIVGEPNALICFTGPRVIKETIKEDLPEGFQRSEFLLEHGFLDHIVPRNVQREFIGSMIKIHKYKKREK